MTWTSIQAILGHTLLTDLQSVQKMLLPNLCM